MRTTRLILVASLALPLVALAADDTTAELIFRGTFRSPFKPPATNDPPPPKVNLGAGWVGPRPRREAAEVVGTKGLDFGLLFVPRTPQAVGTAISLRYVTRFPAPGQLKPGRSARETQAESQINCLVGMACTARYVFDEDWEIVPGFWRFEIYAGDKKVLEESIHVQAPSGR